MWVTRKVVADTPLRLYVSPCRVLRVPEEKGRGRVWGGAGGFTREQGGDGRTHRGHRHYTVLPWSARVRPYLDGDLPSAPSDLPRGQT